MLLGRHGSLVANLPVTHVITLRTPPLCCLHVLIDFRVYGGSNLGFSGLVQGV